MAFHIIKQDPTIEVFVAKQVEVVVSQYDVSIVYSHPNMLNLFYCVKL